MTESHEDCQGNVTTAYRCRMQASDGRHLTGIGATKEQARENAERQIERWELFIKQSPMDQLASISAKERILSDDMERAMRLVVSVLADLGAK